MSEDIGFDRATYHKRVAVIQLRLAENQDARSALLERSGMVPDSKWDEYKRLWEEMKAIKRDLFAVIDEIIPHDPRPLT